MLVKKEKSIWIHLCHSYHSFPLLLEIFGIDNNSNSSKEKGSKYFSSILFVVSFLSRRLFVVVLLPSWLRNISVQIFPDYYSVQVHHCNSACNHMNRNSSFYLDCDCFLGIYDPIYDRTTAADCPHILEEASNDVCSFFRFSGSYKN